MDQAPPETSFIRNSRINFDNLKADSSADIIMWAKKFLETPRAPPPFKVEQKVPGPANGLWKLLQLKIPNLESDKMHWFVRLQALIFVNDSVSKETDKAEVAEVVNATTGPLMKQIYEKRKAFTPLLSSIFIAFCLAAPQQLYDVAPELLLYFFKDHSEQCLNCCYNICQEVPLSQQAWDVILAFCLNKQYTPEFIADHRKAFTDGEPQVLLEVDERNLIMHIACESAIINKAIEFPARVVVHRNYAKHFFATAGIPEEYPILCGLFDVQNAPPPSLSSPPSQPAEREPLLRRASAPAPASVGAREGLKASNFDDMPTIELPPADLEPDRESEAALDKALEMAPIRTPRAPRKPPVFQPMVPVGKPGDAAPPPISTFQPPAKFSLRDPNDPAEAIVKPTFDSVAPSTTPAATDASAASTASTASATAADADTTIDLLEMARHMIGEDSPAQPKSSPGLQRSVSASASTSARIATFGRQTLTEASPITGASRGSGLRAPARSGTRPPVPPPVTAASTAAAAKGSPLVDDIIFPPPSAQPGQTVAGGSGSSRGSSGSGADALRAQNTELQRQLAKSKEELAAQADRIKEYVETINSLSNDSTSVLYTSQFYSQNDRMRTELALTRENFEKLNTKYQALKEKERLSNERLEGFEKKQEAFKDMFAQANSRYETMKSIAYEKINHYKEELDKLSVENADFKVKCRDLEAQVAAGGRGGRAPAPQADADSGHLLKEIETLRADKAKLADIVKKLLAKYQNK